MLSRYLHCSQLIKHAIEQPIFIPTLDYFIMMQISRTISIYHKRKETLYNGTYHSFSKFSFLSRPNVESFQQYHQIVASIKYLSIMECKSEIFIGSLLKNLLGLEKLGVPSEVSSPL